MIFSWPYVIERQMDVQFRTPGCELAQRDNSELKITAVLATDLSTQFGHRYGNSRSLTLVPSRI